MELNSEYLTERLEIRILEAHFDLAKKLLNYVKKNQEHFYFMYGFVDYDSVEEMYDFLKRRKLTNNPFYGLFLKGSDELIGSISMTGYDKKNGKAEIGYTLDKNFVHQGYMTEAVTFFAEEMMRQGCRKLIAYIDIENVDSQKVCERCGFIKEARLIKEKFDRHKSEFVDIYLYCKFDS